MIKRRRFLFIGAISFLLSSFIFVNQDIKETKAIDILDYSSADSCYQSKNANGLLTALRNITSKGQAGSYDGLYTTYKKCFLREDGYVRDYYSNATKYDVDKDQAGSYDEEGDCYNREHSIPSSWWGGSHNNQGADPFIVIPTDGYVNNRRSAHPLGYVDSVKYASKNNYSKLGTAVTTWGYTGTVFEPNDEVKGDLARNVFYAIAKYENSYNWIKAEGKNVFSGSPKVNFGLTDYSIKLLTYWHNLDKVDDFERNVNKVVGGLQGNRNPFIDHPEYVNVLWPSGTSYEGEIVPIDPGEQETGDSITLNIDEKTIKVGETFSLNAINSKNEGIYWSIDDSSIASISKTYDSSSDSYITVKGLKEGTTTIYAKASGDDYKTCSLTVLKQDEEFDPIDLGDGYWVETNDLNVGDKITFVNRQKSMIAGPLNNKVLSALSVSFDDDNNIVTLPEGTSVFEVKNGTKTGCFNLLNENGYLRCSSEKVLKIGNSESDGNKEWSIRYDDNKKSNVLYTEQTNAGYLQYNSGSPRFTTYKSSQSLVTFYKFIKEQEEPIEKVLSSIVVSDYTDSIKQNEEYVFDGKVVAYYENEDEGIDVTSLVTISEIDTSSIGDKEIEISYVENNIEVKESITINVYKYVTGIEVNLIKDEFYVGETFIFVGEIYAIYSDESEEKIEEFIASSIDINVEGEKIIDITFTIDGEEYDTEIVVNYIKKEEIPDPKEDEDKEDEGEEKDITPPSKEEDNKDNSKGCGGSILASSALISISSIMCLSFVILKKKGGK